MKGTGSRHYPSTWRERALGFPHRVPICTTAVIVLRPPAVGSFALRVVSAHTWQGTVPALELLQSKSVRQIDLGKAEVISLLLLGSYHHIQSITPQGPNLRATFAGEGCWTMRCTPERRGSISKLCCHRHQSKHSSYLSTSRRCRHESFSYV